MANPIRPMYTTDNIAVLQRMAYLLDSLRKDGIIQ